MGLSQVHGISDVLEPGSVGILHFGGILPGGVLVASVYLHRSIGLAAQNWAILCRLGGVLRSTGLPFVLAGDFNLGPEVLDYSGWVSAIDG
eukprot:5954516-Pyramimonas_sp.AAC.1